MLKRVKQAALIVFGVMLTAFGISVFYVPNKIVSGGVSGISTILYHIFHIPTGLSFAVINVVLLLLAFHWLGKAFVLKTLAAAGLLSLFVQIFSYVPPVTENVILATLFGAVLYGLGIAIALSQGASTGGTDILGRLIQYRFPHMPIGTLLLIVDLCVVFASLLAFGEIDLSLWGIIALFVCTFSIDWFIRRLNVSKCVLVVTDCGEEIAKKLVSTSPRGVTILKSVGAYTMEKNNILLCALKEHEMPAFQKKITEIDPQAFVIFLESQQILGNGFHIYR